VRSGDGAGVAAGVTVGDALGELEGSDDAVATASVEGGGGA